MIAPVRTSPSDNQIESGHDQFLAMLPQILLQAKIALCGLQPEAREELTQEVVANAYCAFVQLLRRGKADLAYPTPLTQFALRQIRAGRFVAVQQNVHDVLSPYAGRVHGLTIERLDLHDGQTGMWNQLLVEDHRAGPAETAAARLDLAAWFRKLSPRNRRIARALAVGESTSIVARRFELSPGRVSQLRTWFRNHWEQFQAGTGSQISVLCS